VARAACAWAIPGCQRGRGTGRGGGKGVSVQQTGTEGFSILSGQVRSDAVFPLAPLSHRSLHQRRMAAALHHCHVTASLRSCTARALRVRSRRSDAAMRRVSIWGGMLPFPGRLGGRPLLGVLRRPGSCGMSDSERLEQQRACVAQAHSSPPSLPMRGACFQRSQWNASRLLTNLYFFVFLDPRPDRPGLGVRRVRQLVGGRAQKRKKNISTRQG
jgi:hypothetical protein